MFNLKHDIVGGDTKVQQQDPLKGYEEVSREDWMSIESQTYVRYEKSDGQLVRGGFIISKSIDKGLLFLQADLANSAAAKWTVSISKIARLWKKSKDNTNGDINTLARTIKAINERVTTLEQLDYKDLVDTDNSSHDDLRGTVSELKGKVHNIEDDIRKLLSVINDIVATINDDTKV